jgi:hypothetical protein
MKIWRLYRVETEDSFSRLHFTILIAIFQRLGILTSASGHFINWIMNFPILFSRS